MKVVIDYRLTESDAIDDRFGRSRKLPAASRIRQNQSAKDDADYELVASGARYSGGVASFAGSNPGESGHP